MVFSWNFREYLRQKNYIRKVKKYVKYVENKFRIGIYIPFGDKEMDAKLFFISSFCLELSMDRKNKDA